MKPVHKAGIPCGSTGEGLTYTHQISLVTCKNCLHPKKAVEEKFTDIPEEKPVKDDKRRTRKITK